MASHARSRWILAGSALGAAAAALALALAARWAVRHGLDSFRARIERAVAQSTGRPFRLEGPLRIRLAPVAIEAGPAQLGNPPGMSGPPLAQWRSTRIALELLPLLHQRLVVDDVTVAGLQIHLQRTRDGRTNWSGLFAGSPREVPARPERPAAGARALQVEMRALAVRGGDIDWIDGQTAPRVRLSSVSVDAGPVRWAAQLSIGAVRLAGQLSLAGQPGSSPVELALAGLELSQTPYEATVSRASLRAADARVETSLTAAEAGRGWQARGALSAHVASVRDLAERLGLQLPRTRDPDVFAALSLTSGWVLAGGTLDIESLRAHLDETTIAGRIALTGAAGTPRIALDLRGDHVDLDRYSPPQSNRSGRSELSIGELRALPIEGTVSFDEARLANTDMKQVKLEMGSLARIGRPAATGERLH